MNKYAKILKVEQNDQGTYMAVFIPNEYLKDKIDIREIVCADIRLDDGRSISNLQRGKIHATLNDMAVYWGWEMEEMKDHMKSIHMARTGCDPFSFKDCDMTTAR